MFCVFFFLYVYFIVVVVVVIVCRRSTRATIQNKHMLSYPEKSFLSNITNAHSTSVRARNSRYLYKLVSLQSAHSVRVQCRTFFNLVLLINDFDKLAAVYILCFVAYFSFLHLTIIFIGRPLGSAKQIQLCCLFGCVYVQNNFLNHLECVFGAFK